MTTNATHGNYEEDAVTTMRFFDKLPPELREFNRNCLVQWATGPQFRNVQQVRNIESYIEHMIMSDVATVRRDAKEGWGLQVNDYIEAQRRRRRRDYLDKPAHSRL
ncbi:MAG: hypothetical protein E5V91_22770 [Mesorhizobium sp.]|nr:MAG: hypothetical protein E5V91_22770 [Mesorhizobium sp.]